MSLIEPTPEPTFSGPLPVESEPAPTPAAEVPPADVPFESLPATWQKEIKDLREESGRWRTQTREYESVWDGYDLDEQRQLAEFLRLSRAAEDGDEDAASQLREMLGQPEPEPEPEPTSLTADDYRRIAREEAERIASEREAARSEQDAVKGIVDTAKSLGYEHNSPDYILLLRFANEMDQPDLKAADQMVKDWKRAEFDKYLAEKEQAARETPATPSGAGAAPNLSQTPRTYAEARQALHERLSNIS